MKDSTTIWLINTKAKTWSREYNCWVPNRQNKCLGSLLSQALPAMCLSSKQPARYVLQSNGTTWRRRDPAFANRYWLFNNIIYMHVARKLCNFSPLCCYRIASYCLSWEIPDYCQIGLFSTLHNFLLAVRSVASLLILYHLQLSIPEYGSMTWLQYNPLGIDNIGILMSW